MPMTRDAGDDAQRSARIEAMFLSLWETTQDAVFMLGEDGIIRHANPGAERMFGHPRAVLQGGPLARVQSPAMGAFHSRAMDAYIQSGQRRLDWRVIETVGQHADGHAIPLDVSISEMKLDGERIFVGFLRDTTARRQATDALRAERERAQSTLRCIGDGVLTTDAEGRVAGLNPVAERLTGWRESDALRMPWERVLVFSHQHDGSEVALRLAATEGEGVAATPLPADAMLHDRHGAAVPVEGSVAMLDDGSGRGHGWVIALRDVSRARGLSAQLAYQATHDTLTGLVNRGEFDRRLRRALRSAETDGRPCSLLYLDLDQFKIVNDTCGHQAGDELLVQLATIVSQELRPGDTLARLGGDEFGVLVEGCSERDALQVGERIRAALAAFMFVWKGQLFNTSASIGHVHVVDGSLQAGDVLSRADEACYVAKDLGRNRIHSYQAGEEAQAQRHSEMQWVGVIHRAFDERRFVLHAQPIIATARDGKPSTHYEVLLRMRDASGALVPPMAFIPAAERYGLMPRLDRWVVHAVLTALAATYDDPGSCDVCLAINLSGGTLSDPAFADYLLEELRTSGLSGACITFEITETAAIANLASAVRLVETLKAAGCRFALDDFGSGLSSFAYLKRLPVDFLKIDGSFVRGVAHDPIDRAMVASINEIGHLMGLATIAECVEDEATLEALRSIGVDYAQGYGIGRPAPLEDCLAEVRTRAQRRG